MNDSVIVAAVIATFLLAGYIKGVVGLGMPSISLALLTATIGLKPAMALLLAPVFVTNAWQAVAGGNGKAIFSRTWPFLVAATVTIWFGAQALTRIDVSALSALLGALLVVYAILGLSHPRLSIPRRWEAWAGPLLGAVNGVLTGMTGASAVPGVLYLQAIGLSRDMLVQAMGMLFAASALGLAVSLGGQQLLTAQLGILSVAAVVPAVLGMMLGQRLRGRITEANFRKVFLIALAMLGAFIIVKSGFSLGR